jgi:hypothetical protein
MIIKPLIKNYTIFYLIQCALLFSIPQLSKSNLDKILLSGISFAMLVLFILGTTKILKGLNVSQSRFNAVFFGCMGLRMISTLILISIYLVISPLINKLGIIFLICAYFIYMSFEIKFILPKLRTDSEKSKITDDARK